MTEIECVAKKWGSSIGVVIPKDVVDKERIHPDDKIVVTIRKISLMSSIWDLGPRKRLESTQKVKDELRAGW